MSIVACRVNKDNYEIAADSITVRGYTQEKGDRTKHSKLWESNGLIVGGVGFCEELGLLQFFAGTHQLAAATEGALLEFLVEFSAWKKRKINKPELENSYLMGIEDIILYVNQWHITRVSTFEAIGAGEDFALAALHLGHSAEEAVRVATELSIYCETPIQVKRRTFKGEGKGVADA